MAVPSHPSQNRRFIQGEPDFGHLERAPLDEMPAGSFQSSNVHSAIYDFGDRTCFVRYLRSGPDAIYQYWEVPARVWNGLVNAASKGSYIHENLAFDYTYALFGRDDFPDRGHGIEHDLMRRFVTSP